MTCTASHIQSNKKLERTAVEVRSGKIPALMCVRDRGLSPCAPDQKQLNDGFSNTALEVCAAGTGVLVGAWGSRERGCGHDYARMGPE